MNTPGFSAGNTTGARGHVLQLATRILRSLAIICMRHGVVVPELVKILEREAADVALYDPEFAVPGRSDKHAQSAAHAAVLTGMQRARIKRIAANENPVDPESGQLHRLLRILTGWRTEPRYVDENGKPLDIHLNGSHPSLHQLRVKYGNDTTTRAVADALVSYGCAEWVGDNGISTRDKKLRFVQPVIAVAHHTDTAALVLTQGAIDHMHSLQRSFHTKVESISSMPRFCQNYFNDIDLERADAARALMHQEMEKNGVRITEILKPFRAIPGKHSVRMGVGSYSFMDAPLLVSGSDEASANDDNHD